ncbi:MAG: M48 family metallopeptidase [Roseobacter sp.]
MDYWADQMQDDCYLIAADGWTSGVQPREIVKVKNKDNKLVWPEPADYLIDARHRVVPSHIDGWEQKLGVRPKQYFLQRMKTKWGSCNHAAQTTRLNSELLKKPVIFWII